MKSPIHTQKKRKKSFFNQHEYDSSTIISSSESYDHQGSFYSCRRSSPLPLFPSFLLLIFSPFFFLFVCVSFFFFSSSLKRMAKRNHVTTAPLHHHRTQDLLIQKGLDCLSRDQRRGIRIGRAFLPGLLGLHRGAE